MSNAGQKPGWAFALRSEADGSVEIDVMDVIGEWCGPNAVTARNLVNALNAAQDAKSVRVRINSGGGDVWEGLAIHSALVAHPAKVEIIVLGVAASIASIIAMAGDTITMAPGSFMMVHNPWSIAMGESSDLRSTADYLDKIRDSLVGIYARRTKRSEDEIRELMDAETWMKAEEAVEAKFADRVDSAKKTGRAPKAMAFASIADFMKVPEELRAAMQALAVAQPTTSPAPEGTAQPQPEALGKENKTMPENKPEPTNVISIARALELPAGATEQDAIAAAVRLRQLEVQVQALTGAQSTAEAMGALRAMKEDAGKYKASQEELAKVKLERDAQNFEALLAQAETDRKLNPAEQKYERELFAKAVAEGRGAARVDELRGYLAIKSPDPRVARDIKQPSGSGTPLCWNGKAYRDLKPMQKAALAKENPELYRLMKEDHEAGAAA